MKNLDIANEFRHDERNLDVLKTLKRRGVSLTTPEEAYATALAVAAGVVAGLVPAWMATRGDVNNALKGRRPAWPTARSTGSATA